MTRWKTISRVLVAALLLSMLTAAPASAGGKTRQRSNLYDFSTAEQIDGAHARLVREDDEVEARVRTSGTPGDAVTLWWVVFDDPGGCVGGGGAALCGEADVISAFGGNNAADVTVIHADGDVTNRRGINRFRAELGTSGPGGHEVLIGDGTVDNPTTAEIHLVVRTHGPASTDEATLYAQLSSFGGGCDPVTEAPCMDTQFAIFPGSA